MPEEVILIIMAGMGCITYLGVSLMRTVSRMQERKLTVQPETKATQRLVAELEDLRGQVAEADGWRERVAELEERVDFAERLLSSREAPPQLPQP